VSNNLEVDNLVQPFNVSSSTRVQIQKDMIRFGNPAVMVTTVFGSQMLVGPVFQPQSFLTLTAVQYFRPLVAAETTRQVALVNMATIPRVNLLSPADSQFAPGTDVTENGLVTHNLTTPITLVAYAEYALIGVVSPTERWVENDDVAYSIDCNVTGTAVGSGIDPLEITQVDTPPTFHFFAFRTQAANVFNQITWDVAQSKGSYARFPPGYVRGMNVSVSINGENVFIEPGYATSGAMDSNLIVPVTLTLSAQTGINGLDQGVFEANRWYNVFAVGASRNGWPVVGMFSLGSVEPNPYPKGYDCSRRLGVVQWIGSSFLRMTQFGDGTTRETLYPAPQPSGVSPILGPTIGYETLPLGRAVPPTAIQAQIRIQTFMTGNTNTPNSHQTNALVRFRQSGMIGEGVWTVGIANDPITIADQWVVLSQSFIPMITDVRVFAGTGGNIPDSPLNPNVGQMSTGFATLSYIENI